MNDLLKKIYEAVIVYDKDAVKMGSLVDTEIANLIEPYRNQWTNEEVDKIKNLLYQTALTAEQEGFQLGIKYTLKMLFDILAD